MLDYYAARAAEYDRIYAKPERQADLRDMEAWLSGAFIGRRVLEIACGTGYWTQFIAPGAAGVIGLDASAETIAIARTRVDPAKVHFVIGDAYALPRLEPTPDAAFAGFWLSHVPRARVRAFLAALNDVLTPGARVILVDNRYVPASSTPISETDADGDTWQLRRLADGSTHRVLKNFPVETDLHTALVGLGASLRYRAWTHYWALEYVAERSEP
jgi:demethylmenaquinone methyltransferase/2-methoxy-6-polyprenyl-1,4-benzoquinol methylase